MPHLSLTPRDREEMLRTIGVPDSESLFADIPAPLRDKARDAFAQFEGPKSELVASTYFKRLAARNDSAETMPSFLGAGIYDHFIPSLVPALALRGEFLTNYTPYQAEASQGTLQVIYEFQTLLCQLTGMEMANASLYDGATGLAEAIIMATTVTKRRRVLLPRTVSPAMRRVAETYLQGLNIELVEVEGADGLTSTDIIKEALGKDVAAIVVQQPNFFGNLEDAQALSDAAHAEGALLISIFNPATLGILPPPGDYDADIAIADGQPLGIPMTYGGPGVGLFCCRKSYARFAPGRLAGLTTDAQGRRGYTLTLQTREQHIRREKATSNICTNQALCALQASIYLAALGPRGLESVSRLSHDKAHYLAEQVSGVEGCERAFEASFFNEFALKVPGSVKELNAKLHGQGFIGGYDLGRDYPEYENVMLLAATEKRTREEIDAFVEALRASVGS